MDSLIYIVGGGVAGMAAALKLRVDGFNGKIIICEAGNHIGGRAASNFIPAIGSLIDDNHMIVKANKSILSYLKLLKSDKSIGAFMPRLYFKRKSLGKLADLAIESILNTSSKSASKSLLFKTICSTLLQPVPLMVKNNFNDSFVAPFLTFAKKHKITIKYGMKCESFDGKSIVFSGKKYALGNNEKVIFALPYYVMERIFPFIPHISYNPITNIHFALAKNTGESLSFCGVVGGIGHWYKTRGNILSVTISNFDAQGDEIIGEIWNEAKKVLRLKGNYIKAVVVRQKRATIAQTEQNLRARNIGLQKLQLKGINYAGDWALNNLPCTLEAAIKSGFIAASKALQ